MSTARRVSGRVRLLLGTLLPLGTVTLVATGGAPGTAAATPRTTRPPVAAPSTAVLPAATPARALKAATPCAVTAKACMALSSHQAWLTDGAGNVTYGPVPSIGGMSSAPTPVGIFKVLWKNKHFYSTEFHAPMPYSVFFYPGDAFHADNTSVESHGCIHLTRSAAQRFYDTLQLGDQVQVVN